MSGQRKVMVVLAVLAVLWAVGRATGDDQASTSTTPARHRTTGTPASPPPTQPSITGRPGRPAGSTVAAHEPAPPGTAAAALAGLPVKGRAAMTGYSRERFGQAWLDADRNGCDTRNDILRRDVVDVQVAPGTAGCVVVHGVLHDPYLGRDVPFARGAGDQVDIDHVVALGNAWATGAARLDIHQRAALANDPLELLAVDAGTNRSKGDGDAATWLPPYRPFRCAYVARQVAVKRKYHLWVTPAERDAIARVLRGCPDQRLPRDLTHAPTRVDQHLVDPGDPAPPSPRGLAGSGSVSYANCDAVRAAGAAPLHVDDPGYSRSLDRDGDGVACE